MKTNTTSQEMLLNTGAGYCRRQWCEKKEEKRAQPLPAEEQLKNLCWDGMLPEMFPEICLKENNKPLILWEMMSMQRLLHLRFGGIDEQLDPHYSLNPYHIIDHQHLC